MKLRKFLLPLLAALTGLAASASAQTQTTLATIARVNGAATVTLADGTITALTVGMKVPQGATLTTGPDGDVYLESHPGYITAIKPGSTVLLEEISVTTTGGKVTEEKTLLDLKDGDVVAILDPKKKSVNNYQVRTAAGVARANGTVFTVQFKGGTYTIAVVNGQVSITPPGGGESTPLEAGFAISASSDMSGLYISEATKLLSDYADTTTAGVLAKEAASSQNQANELSELMAVVVATVAVAAQNNIGGTTAAEAAQVAQAVFAAVPGAAAQAAALITKSTAPGQDNSAVVNAIAAVVPASQQAAFNQSITTGTFQQTTVNVTTVSTTTTTVTPPTSIDAVTISRSN